MLSVDIIEGCNFKCYFCPAREVEKHHYMELDFFKRIIMEAKELGITVLDLVPLKGEPFLHPDIYEILDFANEHMKEISLITNLSAANVSKLKEVNLSHTSLTVSYYGDTVEKFKEMTVTNESLFKIVHRKLEELKKHKIPHTICRQDNNLKLNYDDKEHLPPLGAKKCPQHQMPRISPQGDVTFCKFIVGRSGYIPDINFGNLHDMTLKEALSNPLRYKFFDTESICRKHCVDVSESCVIKPTLTSYKIMIMSKKQYEKQIEVTDEKYKILELVVDKVNREDSDVIN